MKSRFIIYGARAIPPSNATDKKPKNSTQDGIKELLNTWLDLLANLQVPHTWFLHFYVVSLLSSIFWAYQILTGGPFFKLIAGNEKSASAEPKSSMSTDQLTLVWSLMTLQAVRRLWESIQTAKPSTSKMFLAHWLMGLTFYLCMGVAIWVEGTGTLNRGQRSKLLIWLSSFGEFVWSHELTLSKSYRSSFVDSFSMEKHQYRRGALHSNHA